MHDFGWVYWEKRVHGHADTDRRTRITYVKRRASYGKRRAVMEKTDTYGKDGHSYGKDGHLWFSLKDGHCWKRRTQKHF